MILIVAFLTIVLLSYIKFRLGRLRMYELAADLQGPKEYPLIGHAHLFAGSTEDILKTVKIMSGFAQQHDGVCKVWLGPLLYVALTNPVDIEIVLNSCLQKDRVYKFMKPWLGNGLVSGSVPIWKRHRRMLVPTFNQKILNGFIDVFWEQSNILMEKIRPKVGGSAFDIFSFVSACTLDIVCETAMGVKVNAQQSLDTPYLRASFSQMKIVYKRMFQIWLQPDFLFKLTPYKKIQEQNIGTLHAFTNRVISKKRQDYTPQDNHGLLESEETIRKAFLDLMMDLTEHGEKFTDVELREEVDTMTIAGNDTSALVSCFTLVMIGSHPSVQEKVVAELHEVFGDSKRGITKEDLSKMHYLERVIKETLRLYPVAPVIVRLTENEVKLTSAIIPEGTGCVVSVWGLHRDKSIWGDDVHEFDPDRFLPERSAKRHPCSYVPFSYGVRNCIGRQYAMMSIKTLISTFVRHYKIKADPHIPLKAEILLRPIHGHFVSIEER